MNNQGANRRQSVDEIVKNLGKGKVTDIPEITASLMKYYRILDNNCEAERDALKEVLASNVLLAKAVGEMATEMAKLRREVDFLKARR